MPDAGPLPALGSPGAPLDEPKSPLGKFTAGSTGRGIRAPHLRLIEGGKNRPRGPIQRRTPSEARQPPPRPVVLQNITPAPQAAPAPSEAQTEPSRASQRRAHAFGGMTQRAAEYFRHQPVEVQDRAIVGLHQAADRLHSISVQGSLQALHDEIQGNRQKPRTKYVRRKDLRRKRAMPTATPPAGEAATQDTSSEDETAVDAFEAIFSRQPHTDEPEPDRHQYPDWQAWAQEVGAAQERLTPRQKKLATYRDIVRRKDAISENQP